ncbi:hypothetical protein Dsin_019303 [Dipteronia sinensis]|uniref:Uncharacterized protein n=1 Tax=Dipteronia sinensis TaxID=43782 RepID=A0AAE0E2D8_9ROSI|nr:hypothetical protein Dsin_019303 [Dipteronia sinensis]
MLFTFLGETEKHNTKVIGFERINEQRTRPKYIVGSLAASFVVAYACDYIISDKKIFGGTIPGTVSNQEWFEETDKKFQAWPRVAGPPVVMNPISRQNFIVKSRTEA